MKDTLKPGLEGVFRYRVPESKTVPRERTLGTHERHVILLDRFAEKIATKAARAGAVS